MMDGPPLRVLQEVGTHAACVGDFPYRTADIRVPTFTQGVKVGQPGDEFSCVPCQASLNRAR
jgi:hypothetical protein